MDSPPRGLPGGGDDAQRWAGVTRAESGGASCADAGDGGLGDGALYDGGLGDGGLGDGGLGDGAVGDDDGAVGDCAVDDGAVGDGGLGDGGLGDDAASACSMAETAPETGRFGLGKPPLDAFLLAPDAGRSGIDPAGGLGTGPPCGLAAGGLAAGGLAAGGLAAGGLGTDGTGTRPVSEVTIFGAPPGSEDGTAIPISVACRGLRRRWGGVELALSSSSDAPSFSVIRPDHAVTNGVLRGKPRHSPARRLVSAPASTSCSAGASSGSDATRTFGTERRSSRKT